MIAAADELGTVLEKNPVSRLDRRPVGQHGGADVLAAAVTPDRSVDSVPGPQLSQRPGPAVRHQDRRLAFQAVGARMLAATVGVDRPLERHPGRLGHPVHHGLGLYLEEGHAAETRRIKRTGDRTALDQRERAVPGRGEQVPGLSGLRRLIEPQTVPAHTEHDRMIVR